MNDVNTFKTSYLILKEEGLIIESCEGVMTLDALLMHKKYLYADPDYNPYFDVLTDISHVTYDMSEVVRLGFLAKTKGVGIFGKGKNAALISTAEHKFQNESFRKISSFLSIKHSYSTSLEEVLDYLDHKELKEVVSRFLLEKRKNKDFEWIPEPKKSFNLFKSIKDSVQSVIKSKKSVGDIDDIFRVRYKIIPKRNLILESYSGLVTLDDLENHARLLAADPEFNNSYDHLLDVRNVIYRMRMEDLAIFVEAARVGNFVDKKKFGVWVATQNQLDFNNMFAHMFEGFSLESKTFKKLDEVLAFTNQEAFKAEIEAFFENNQPL